MQIRRRKVNDVMEALCWVLLLELPLLFGNAGSILLYAFLFVYYFFGGKSRYSIKKFAVLIPPILLAVVIGAVRGFGAYNLFKDVFYLLTPIIAVMIGEIWARRRRPREIPSFIITLGVIFATINIIMLLSQYGLKVLIDPRLCRDTAENYNTVDNIAVLSIAFAVHCLITGKKLRFGWPKLIILFVAIYLSGSRSLYLVVMLYILAVLFPMYRKNFAKFLGIASVFAILLIIFASTTSGNRILDLFEYSFKEMNVQNYDSMEDVNVKYRGYEAYRAMREYEKLPTFNKIFGGGCGQTVNLGEFSPFGFSEVPVLHNGYPYFLIKIGIVGLIVFVAFFLYLLSGYVRKLRRMDVLGRTSRLFYLMGFPSVVAMLLMQASVNAIFNFSYVAPLYMISMIGYYEKKRLI